MNLEEYKLSVDGDKVTIKAKFDQNVEKAGIVLFDAQKFPQRTEGELILPGVRLLRSDEE